MAATYEAAFTAYDERFSGETATLKAELADITDELEGLALEMPKNRNRPTIYQRQERRADELERRKAELEPKLAPLTGRARAIIDRLTAIRETIDQADKLKLALLLEFHRREKISIMIITCANAATSSKPRHNPGARPRITACLEFLPCQPPAPHVRHPGSELTMIKSLVRFYG